MLRCWAVPKGPSLSTDDKRLAVETEDHPIEYADFEGIIPAGNYGAGPMIVWDRGQWISHDDPDEGMAKGKLLFDLKGYKLRGLWTLVRTKRNPKEWLLIKKPDFAATGEDAEAIGGESVLSGLTVEELEAGGDRAAALRADLERAGARRRRVRAKDVKPMLAEHRDRPFTRAGWLFELKYDGYRVIAGAEPAGGGAGSGGGGAPGGGPHGGRDARLFYRSGRDATATFPDLARALVGAALRVGGPRRRGGGARRRGPPQLRAPPAALPPHPPRRRRAGGGGAPGDLLRLRPPRLRGLRPPPAAAGPEEGVPPPRPAAGRPAPLRRPRRGAGRGALRRGAAGRGRGGGGQARRRALPRRALAGLAQDPRRAQRRLRGGRLHPAAGVARRLRRPPPRRA